jgi:hypothetical protein
MFTINYGKAKYRYNNLGLIALVLHFCGSGSASVWIGARKASKLDPAFDKKICKIFGKFILLFQLSRGSGSIRC